MSINKRLIDRKLYEELANLIIPPLQRSDVMDICINKPGEYWLSTYDGWEHCINDELTEDWCETFIHSMSEASSQTTDEAHPLLATTLYSGERIQGVMMPAAEHHAIVIRRPSDRLFTLDDFHEQGAFEIPEAETKAEDIKIARELYAAGKVREMLEFSVMSKLNVIISGPTGSGKTTLSKAAILHVPNDERLICIEDSPELEITQPNHVRLYYSRDNSGISPATAHDLFMACLRKKPDRVFAAELRGGEAYAYLRNVVSGHPGSITTVHADSANNAVTQLVLMLKESSAGATFETADLVRFVEQSVDVILQWQGHKLAGAFFPGVDEYRA